MDLNEFIEQLRQVKKLGPLKDIFSQLPGMDGVDFAAGIPRIEAMVRVMTPEERKAPDQIGPEQMTRIAAESGTNVAEVNQLLKQFRRDQTDQEPPPDAPVPREPGNKPPSMSAAVLPPDEPE